MKNVLIIHGHPVADTFVDKLTEQYVKGVKASGSLVEEIVLKDLSFDINFKEGYRGNQELEPDLLKAQKLISWADHLVFFYPNWWATYPALLKGFIDRTFLPGFAFKYNKGNSNSEQLLKGKTARLVVTMDTSVWYYYLVQKAPGHHSMREAILHFCGIKPVRISSLGPMRSSSSKQRVRWLKNMYRFGLKQI
ncbi:MAG: NADPH:quinone reductase [Bacteroidetes bacterium HGW-Bacteroidetes-1]|jgi:putative NADPH-quinone reductase|nr:MAG: NADPH:quinone reductase [Bacteroidetes bacterium HGW-Bacteroidetes-1]